jgi:arylsulfatase A-like enzyme
MDVRNKGCVAFLLLLFVGLRVHLQAAPPSSATNIVKPNIILIFVDDWAWNGTPIRMDDQMENSAMPVLKMPNLERMAHHGMKFRNAYSGAPQCSPARVCVQTGKAAARSGFTVYMNARGSDYYDQNKAYSQFPVVPCVSDMTIDEDAVTIPEALNPLGYVCAHFGKWHMRGDPGDEGYIAHDGDLDNKPGNQKIPDDPKLMFSVTERSIAFMEKQAQSKQPFYLQISHFAMHEGRECLAETRRKYAKLPELQAYYRQVNKTAETISARQDPATWLGMGEDLDGRIGAVLQKIEDLGIADNTYVIMTADNGYRHKFYPGRTQPLHGGKWWVWQGGLRVPMIVTGPGIPAGSASVANVVNYDFLPTFVEWAGGDPNQLKGIDGISLAGILRGETPGARFTNRSLYFHYPHYRTSMPHSTMVAGAWKVMHFYKRPDIPMLFDLVTDEGEVVNVALQYPEKHQPLYDEMMRYFDAVGARLPKENPDYDPVVYEDAKEYEQRMAWGPFAGERPLDEDEK